MTDRVDPWMEHGSIDRPTETTETTETTTTTTTHTGREDCIHTYMHTRGNFNALVAADVVNAHHPCWRNLHPCRLQCRCLRSSEPCRENQCSNHASQGRRWSCTASAGAGRGSTAVRRTTAVVIVGVAAYSHERSCASRRCVWLCTVANQRVDGLDDRVDHLHSVPGRHNTTVRPRTTHTATAQHSTAHDGERGLIGAFVARICIICIFSVGYDDGFKRQSVQHHGALAIDSQPYYHLPRTLPRRPSHAGKK